MNSPKKTAIKFCRRFQTFDAECFFGPRRMQGEYIDQSALKAPLKSRTTQVDGNRTVVGTTGLLRGTMAKRSVTMVVVMTAISLK